jgi:hypothetical protein
MSSPRPGFRTWWGVSARGVAGIEKEKRMETDRALPRALAGEILGTYLLVLFGTGSVAAAVLTSA